MTHEEIDARSLAMHQCARAGPNDQYYLGEWSLALDAGIDTLLALATEDFERAKVLRHSSLFAGVLTSEEHQAFIDARRVRAHPPPTTKFPHEG